MSGLSRLPPATCLALGDSRQRAVWSRDRRGAGQLTPGHHAGNARLPRGRKCPWVRRPAQRRPLSLTLSVLKLFHALDSDIRRVFVVLFDKLCELLAAVCLLRLLKVMQSRGVGW